jgi:hypothetical protein
MTIVQRYSAAPVVQRATGEVWEQPSPQPAPPGPDPEPTPAPAPGPAPEPAPEPQPEPEPAPAPAPGHVVARASLLLSEAERLMHEAAEEIVKLAPTG